MRYYITIFTFLILNCFVSVVVVAKDYLQETPFETLSSLVLASNNNDVDYLSKHASFSWQILQLIDQERSLKKCDMIQGEKLIQNIKYIEDIRNTDHLMYVEAIVEWFLKNKSALNDLRDGYIDQSFSHIGESCVVQTTQISDKKNPSNGITFVKVNNKYHFLILWLDS